MSLLVRAYWFIMAVIEFGPLIEIFVNKQNPVNLLPLLPADTPDTLALRCLFGMALMMLTSTRLVVALAYRSRAAWASAALVHIVETVFFVIIYIEGSAPAPSKVPLFQMIGRDGILAIIVFNAVALTIGTLMPAKDLQQKLKKK